MKRPQGPGTVLPDTPSLKRKFSLEEESLARKRLLSTPGINTSLHASSSSISLASSSDNTDIDSSDEEYSPIEGIPDKSVLIERLDLLNSSFRDLGISPIKSSCLNDINKKTSEWRVVQSTKKLVKAGG